MHRLFCLYMAVVNTLGVVVMPLFAVGLWLNGERVIALAALAWTPFSAWCARDAWREFRKAQRESRAHPET